MEFWIILNLLLTSLSIVGLAFVYKKTSKSDFKDVTQSISTQVVANISQSQFLFLGQILDQINQNNSSQNKELTKNLQNLEIRFSEIQLKIQTLLAEELNKIQQLQSDSKNELKTVIQNLLNEELIQFEKIKQDNQASLTTLRNTIQTQLDIAIKNLLELSSNELGKLHQSNRSNFELLSQSNQEKLLSIQVELDKRLNENLSQNLKSFETVTKNLSQMQSVAQKMIDSTSSIDKLNNIFERTSSKAFGSFGEKYLENLLSEYINPQNWSSQAAVPGANDKIDFIIEVGDQKIGIDSKFPATKYNDYLEASTTDKKTALTAFLKSVTTMAQDIYNKYNKANFLDTIIIYFPSDSMFAEVVNDSKTMESLYKNHINPASPTTIVPILSMIQQYEFKLKIQDNAEVIIKGLNTVRKNVNSFREEFKKLGDKIRQAQQNYETADKNLNVVQKTILQLENNNLENQVLMDSEASI